MRNNAHSQFDTSDLHFGHLLGRTAASNAVIVNAVVLVVVVVVTVVYVVPMLYTNVIAYI